MSEKDREGIQLAYTCIIRSHDASVSPSFSADKSTRELLKPARQRGFRGMSSGPPIVPTNCRASTQCWPPLSDRVAYRLNNKCENSTLFPFYFPFKRFSNVVTRGLIIR